MSSNIVVYIALVRSQDKDKKITASKQIEGQVVPSIGESVLYDATLKPPYGRVLDVRHDHDGRIVVELEQQDFAFVQRLVSSCGWKHEGWKR